MPVRKISKNYRSVTGTFPSYKNQCSISYESLLERDFYLLLEYDNNVISYEEQPFTIYYKRNNYSYKYTPDVLVHYKNSLPIVYEIKMSNSIKDDKVFHESKLHRIEEYVKENDMEFKVFTELLIDSIYLENALFLYRYRTLNEHPFLTEIKRITQNTEITSVNEILAQISDNKFKQAEYLPYIWSMVFHNQLHIDMEMKITNNSILRVNHEKT
jgi:hypothetical protein